MLVGQIENKAERRTSRSADPGALPAQTYCQEAGTYTYRHDVWVHQPWTQQQLPHRCSV